MNQLNLNDFALGSCMQFIQIQKCTEDVQRCHVKICEGSVCSMAYKVEFFDDIQVKKKHCEESDIVSSELPTLSFYTGKNDTMGEGNSLNCTQLPINYKSRNDVCLYKNLIYPEAIRMRWHSLSVPLRKCLVAIFQAINILVFQLESQDCKAAADNYKLSERTKGLQEPSF